MELPEYFIAGYFAATPDQLSPEKRHADQKPGEVFTIDDLLDFSNANTDAITSDGFFNNTAGNSTDVSVVTAVDSCNSSISGSSFRCFAGVDPQFSEEFCVPYDDVAELEWLSNFVEESFPAEEELKTLHLISGVKPQTPQSSSSSDARNAPLFHPETPLPAKARSKRSRAAPGDWSTRVVRVVKTDAEQRPAKKRDGANSEASGRKCLHCAAEQTPQWRTGPMGPKTLCNACGVRYKSGRLVPEYRPAASPTFVSTKHSNSHRKVLELRRQKEMQHHRLIGQSSVFDISNGEDSYLIHRHNRPDYRNV
ncbi:hypothetical protein HN51_042615 [Arachis hypogaea]|uniref:GATA transcription factor n=1 Tax=Arachis hypogaea TaxID=3818 RepID=A0A444Y8X7_ARAHY|nr:GATA transcription factor 9 [Arachis ipaensis]XP_025673549.1 GATA transcription factor 9 [Arachis hypogaea]QHN94734.1 GATA transcription factor [Arachis hypogaea]RYQ98400.1 hypothetical protein Ahy_B08g094440 [Arachis hypogaea]